MNRLLLAAAPLSHGESMCRLCFITNREAAVIGTLNHCGRAEAIATGKEAKRDAE